MNRREHDRKRRRFTQRIHALLGAAYADGMPWAGPRIDRRMRRLRLRRNHPRHARFRDDLGRHSCAPRGVVPRLPRRHSVGLRIMKRD